MILTLNLVVWAFFLIRRVQVNLAQKIPSKSNEKFPSREFISYGGLLLHIDEIEVRLEVLPVQ